MVEANRFGRKWWVLLAVGIASLMSALDGSVANIILPVVRDSFGSDVATIEWVVTVYLLVVSSLLLSFGRLGDLRGNKPVYLVGLVIFVLGSMLSGTAPSAPALIGFRALQALGAAMLMANSPAILTKSFPGEQRGQALGLQAMMTYVGLTIGPSFGGWLATQISWRAVFYINVPIGLLALWLSLRFIPGEQSAEAAERFDLTGAITFTGALVAFLLALNQGAEWGWTSSPILALLTGSVVLLIVFLFVESRVGSPMLDLSLFRNRLFSAATGSAVLNYICIYSALFLLPFYLILGRHLDPAQAGLLLTAQPIAMVIAAPISGTLSDRIGSRLPGTAGMALLALGLFLLSRLDAASPLSQVAIGLAVIGLGTGIFISPNSSALMGSAPRRRQGIAAGILATSRNVGMMLGVGIAGAVFTTVVARNQANSSAALFIAISAGLTAAVAAGLLGVITSAVRGD